MKLTHIPNLLFWVYSTKFVFDALYDTPLDYRISELFPLKLLDLSPGAYPLP